MAKLEGSEEMVSAEPDVAPWLVYKRHTMDNFKLYNHFSFSYCCLGDYI